MENSAKKRKRAEKDSSDESDSDKEVSFNFNRQKRHKMADLSPACMAQITGHFDTKTREIKDEFMLHLGEVKKQVNCNSENIALIKKSIERLEQENASGAQTVDNAKSRTYNAEKNEKYWTSRNSLRIWSIAGTSPEELKVNVTEFLYSTLLIPRNEKIEDRILTIRRSRTAFSSKIKNEVIVIFDTTSTRDFVCSHSKNLGKLGPGLNRLEFGLRLDYPAFLGSDYRILDAYGAKLRRRFGQDFKRNMKFDDDLMALYLDIKLPNKRWIKITPKLAREDRSIEAANNDSEARKLIEESMKEIPEENQEEMITDANATPLGEKQKKNNEQGWRDNFNPSS